MIADGAIDQPPEPIDSAELRSGRFVVPVGSERGWEEAVFDHYRAVAKAIASKLAERQFRSETGDRVGGMTLTFEIHDAHQYAEQVYGLLRSIRAQVNDLWNEVSQYNREQQNNQEHGPVSELVRVTFYAGQNVERADAVERSDQDQAAVQRAADASHTDQHNQSEIDGEGSA